jgi:STAM-binding protein
LTDIEIVSDVVEAFKELSELNTSANPKKETGGLLFGRRVENRFIINTLLIPKQNGYDTYFETSNEYEISNFLNSDPDLVLLGLIHTHPGFDAFLSSIDLHMLHRYTLDNPSVINIVLAPEKNFL